MDFLIVCKDWIVSDIDDMINSMIKNDINYITDCKGKSQFIILSKKYPWGWIYIPKNHWVVRDGVGGLKEYSAKTFHELYSKDGEKR